MVNEKRRSPRSQTYAKILVREPVVPGYMRDLSRQGCQIALLQPVDLQKQRTLILEVLPDQEQGVPAALLRFEVIWSRADPLYFVLGGRIIEEQQPGGRDGLDRLLAYFRA